MSDNKVVRQSNGNKLQHLWLEITEKCNLSCVHCYAESDPSKPMTRGMNIEDWICVLKEARRLNCENIQFIGGEPTVHPGLILLLEESYKLGFSSIEIYTNGLSISNKQMDLFKQWDIKIAVSFYSTNPIVHDRITQKSGSYYKTLDFIQRAIKAGIQLRVGIIQIDQSNDDVVEAISHLKNIGITSLSVDRVRGVGRGNGIIGANVARESCMGELCGECHKGKSCVTSSGDVFPCIMARKDLLGNIKTTSLEDIVEGSRLRDFTERQLAYIKNVKMPAIVSANPCHPQYGNCKPTETNGFSRSDNPCHPQYGNCKPTEVNGFN
jgi:MoaA/NifB/PqqE/SkfB family radical SAM enzyme